MEVKRFRSDAAKIPRGLENQTPYPNKPTSRGDGNAVPLPEKTAHGWPDASKMPADEIKFR
ncbi:MAG: hypothetical protein MI747_05000, partial [Desulfobacterales bacterium]|nr:hypothetical protein [Desulfobacterales bacterium]